MSCQWIEKVGLAALDEGRLLVVRKHGGSMFILPGGKPEDAEGDLAALTRELAEELGCAVSSPSLSGVFTDRAAGIADAVVVVRLYLGTLVGDAGAYQPHGARETLSALPDDQNDEITIVSFEGRHPVADARLGLKQTTGFDIVYLSVK